MFSFALNASRLKQEYIQIEPSYHNILMTLIIRRTGLHLYFFAALNGLLPSAHASFDVQTTWLRNLNVSAEGDPVQPDSVTQTTSGEPSGEYTETYDADLEYFDGSHINLVSYQYSLNSSASAPGVTNLYSNNVNIEALSFLSGQGETISSLEYTTVTSFSTQDSFSLDVLSYSNLLGTFSDFSFWVDGSKWWSLSDGFEAIPSLVPLGQVATYEASELFSGVLFGSDDSFNLFTADFNFGEGAEAHDFEFKSTWIHERTTSGTSYANMTYELDLVAVPEVSMFYIPLICFLLVLSKRERPRKTPALGLFK